MASGTSAPTWTWPTLSATTPTWRVASNGARRGSGSAPASPRRRRGGAGRRGWRGGRVGWEGGESALGTGQLESYEVGPLAAQGFSSASNGFNGFGGITVGTWNRGNYAVYADLERRARDERWTLGLAVRLEDFDDFGTTTNGKLTGFYKLTDAWRVRGGVSTGFRAPTPGQANSHNVTTQFDVQSGELQEHGTIPPTSRVAQLRGGEPLVPES